MYAIADKYELASVKNLARENFRNAVQEVAQVENPEAAKNIAFLISIPRIYESTPSHDQGLRKLALAYIRQTPMSFLEDGVKEHFRDVLYESTEFNFELHLCWMSQ